MTSRPALCDSGQVSRTPPATERTATSRGHGSAAPFWTIWLVAFGIVLALCMAIVRNLSLPSSHAHMDMTADHADAFTRLGSSQSLPQLLGRSLLTSRQVTALQRWAGHFRLVLGHDHWPTRGRRWLDLKFVVHAQRPMELKAYLGFRVYQSIF